MRLPVKGRVVMKKQGLFLGAALVVVLVFLGNRYVSSRAQQALVQRMKSTPIAQNAKAVKTPRLVQGGDAMPSQNVEPLDAEDTKEFFAELETVFLTKATASLNGDALRTHLGRLNERGERGVRSILNQLAKVPKSDKEVQTRLALVDYLRYRMRWDPKLPKAAFDLAVTPIAADTPRRYKAVLMADKAELVNGLSRVNWALAADAIAAESDPTLKDLFAYEAFHGLLSAGQSREEALRAVQTVAPAFSEEGKPGDRKVPG